MRFALLACLLSAFAIGCGGSSSETPPPLQPDPTSALYTGPRFPSASDDAPSAAVSEPLDDSPEPPQRPARATWGSGKPTPSAPAPAALPALTSPTALPPAH